MRPGFFQFSAFRPWKRTIARSALVAAATGGMLEGNPCGSSTETYVNPFFRRNSSVSSRLRSLIQVAFRNSTASRSSGRSSRARTISALFSREITNQSGYWSRTAPSLPLLRSGSRATQNRAKSSSRASFGMASRMSLGKRLGSVWWVVRVANALKFIVKPSGVRSAQSWACFCPGSA